jgi:hypothetical protein
MNEILKTKLNDDFYRNKLKGKKERKDCKKSLKRLLKRKPN